MDRNKGSIHLYPGLLESATINKILILYLISCFYLVQVSRNQNFQILRGHRCCSSFQRNREIDYKTLISILFTPGGPGTLETRRISQRHEIRWLNFPHCQRSRAYGTSIKTERGIIYADSLLGRNGPLVYSI